MANLKASKKDILRNRRNRLRNSQIVSKMRTTIKKALNAVETKDETAETIIHLAIKTIDKSVSKGVLHKKTASRKKSRLMLAFNASLK